jgi:recombination associated protein RdgC
MFKNAFVFSMLTGSMLEPDIAVFNDLLSGHKIREIALLEAAIDGWAPVIGEQLSVQVQGGRFMRMAIKEKVLPAAVVNETLIKTIARIEADEARKIGRKERTEIKEQVYIELLGKALVKTSYIDGFINADYLVVNTTSPHKAEQFSSLLRKSLGSLPASPIKTASPVDKKLTHWAEDAENVPSFLERTGAYLIKSEDSEKKVRMQGFLDGDSLGAEQYAKSGEIVVEMSLKYADKLEFSITDNFTIKGIRTGIEPDPDIENKDEIQLAEMTITAGELTELIGVMMTEFGTVQS